MKRKLIQSIALLVLPAVIALTPTADAGNDKGSIDNPYTLAELAGQIEQVKKKEIVLSSRIIGACKSGCKMWVADGEYKKGDLFTLVRAKDDAFKFDTKAAGQKVILHGYAVARIIDTCNDEGDKKDKEHDKKENGACAGPGTPTKEITFFATKVVYVKN
ncbi:MAG: hypothetical protein H7A51_20030 [Akkermansiaceae bacterium]|nr:hypothetical protein [Akkermansiaceae bacterium]